MHPRSLVLPKVGARRSCVDRFEPKVRARSPRLAVPARLLMSRLARRRAARRWRAELPSALEDVARGLRSGASVESAIADAAGDSTSGPRADLRRIDDRLRTGETLTDALHAWERSAPDVAALPVAALLLASEGGGSRAWALDRVAATLRERAAVEGELRAQVSQARLSAMVVVASPAAFTLVVLVVDPSVLAFFATPIGLGCLLAGVLLDAGGSWWMARLVRSAV